VKGLLARWPREVWWVLGAGLAYRLGLVAAGGQMFYPDEWRYYQSVELLHRLLHEQARGGVSAVLEQGAHVGYVLLGLLPAALQGLPRLALGWSPEQTWFIPAALGAVVSASVPAWIYALARRMGAASREAMLALLLCALSVTLARYCRHLLPYDLALTLALAATWVGLAPETSPIRSAGAGGLAAVAFLTYNGYWPMAGLALVLHVLAVLPRGREALRRALWALVGLLTPVVLLTLAGRAVGADFLFALLVHSGSLIGGHLGEAWTIPGRYLWASEPALLAVWGIGLALAARAALDPTRRRRGLLWGGALLFLYGQMVLGAHLLGQWPVFGRLARMLVPFLCLAAALGWAHVGPAKPALRRLAGLAFALAVLPSLANPWRETFPSDWLPRFKRAYPGELRVMNTNLGPMEEHIEPELLHPHARYVFVNYRILKPIEGRRPRPAGRVLWQRPHPAQFSYNHYNGYWPHERVWLRREDFSMALIDTRPP
jgi:hypothetical protein